MKDVFTEKERAKKFIRLTKKNGEDVLVRKDSIIYAQEYKSEKDKRKFTLIQTSANSSMHAALSVKESLNYLEKHL